MERIKAIGTGESAEVEKLYARLSLLGVVMAMIGVAMEVHLNGEVRRSLWGPGEFSVGLQGWEPSVVTTAGIWILIAGPILGVGLMLKKGAERGSVSTVLICGGVLAVIGLSIPIKIWFQGTF